MSASVSSTKSLDKISASPPRPKYATFRKPSILPLKGPSLDNLKLVNILNDETCSPISFKDFSTFIREKEHTTENLLFVIWYRSYDARWKALSQDIKDRVPTPSTRLGDRYAPFGRGGTTGEKEGWGLSTTLPIGEQPMREEAARAFSTFLRSGGSRALGVSDDLRQFARTCLAQSSAPECFLPIYEEVYNTLELQSLPHFLSYASTNTNHPKQMFWYYVGAFDFLFGLVIYLVLTLLLPTTNFGFRAIRLPSTIFASFGVMQLYSAWRGFCSQVWKRTSRQIRPWEMDDVVDEEVSINGKDEGEGWHSRANLAPTLAQNTTDNRSPRPTSMFAENVFAPTPVRETEIELSPEVHPLTDLGETVSSPASIDEVRPLPSRGSSSEDGALEELDEKQIRQLAIRRSTIKVPDASLAFPINEDDTVSELSPRKTSHRLSNVTSLRPSISSIGSTMRQSVSSPISPSANSSSAAAARRSDISPFEGPADTPATTLSSLEAEREEKSTAELDLGTLLNRFKVSNRVRVQEAGRPKMFGPEELVEDPRVKALMESIVRDILVVGAISGVIWIALCLAVPCVGLV